MPLILLAHPNGLPRLVFSLRWQYQSKSHTYSPHVEMNLANSKVLLVVRPSNNRGRVGNLGNSRPPRVRGQNYRIRRNMPLFTPHLK